MNLQRASSLMVTGCIVLAIISAIGLIASVASHLMGWLQIVPPWGKSLFVLHIGIFVVWLPLVLCANKSMPRPGRGNLDHLLAELPKWVRVLTMVLFGYAFINFAYFWYAGNQYPKHEVPFFVELRGFSGHWMMFYGYATAGFIGLARLARKRRQNELVA